MKIINLPKITDPRGNLTFIESENHIPFEIERVYWIYDVPGGEKRGGHAFKEQQELIIAISGSFDVIVDDGNSVEKFQLNRSYLGLFIPSGKWRHMENFSTNSIALVLASTSFSERDYIRDYNEFLKYKKNKIIERVKKTIFINNPAIKYFNTIFECKIIDLEINHREKGNITVIENNKTIPFTIKRVYYLYDIPGGEERGGHAHKELYQLIVAAGGSFDVELNDGENKKTIALNRPNKGLLVKPGIWREIKNFSSGATCLVLASERYNENDYIRDYNNFIIYKKMNKILIAGCGGAPSEGVINSLLKCKNEEIIGMGSEPSDLILSNAKRKYIVPYADHPSYRSQLLKLLNIEKPNLIHFQNDLEVFEASKLRNEINSLGTQTFMPSHEVIEICVNKYKSYLKWSESGVKVPNSIFINDEKDLKNAFSKLGDKDGKIWLRTSSIGAGGKGALPTNDYEFAKRWIDRFSGWNDFIAAEILTPDTVTWLSIWYEGELVVAQTRIRKGWTHGNRTLSGVTGVTKVGQTYSNETVNSVAIDSILSIDKKPHGIYGVDMAYDRFGFPNPTEINISRFFTTVLFFTEAGLNMPEIFKDIALYKKFPSLEKKINPLPDGLMWMRGMDTKPKLVTESDMLTNLISL